MGYDEEYALREKQEFRQLLQIVFKCCVLLLFLLISGMYGCPQYHVYSERLSGEAALAKSMADRKIQVQDAEGKFEAAKHLANAEIERAKGVSEANKIIGQSLHNNEAYLRYLWIHNLNSNDGKEVIYVPTEAGLPILEAGKRK